MKARNSQSTPVGSLECRADIQCNSLVELTKRRVCWAGADEVRLRPSPSFLSLQGTDRSRHALSSKADYSCCTSVGGQAVTLPC